MIADEVPVTVKKRRVISATESASAGKVCIVHYARCNRDCHIRRLTEHSFETIRQCVKIRKEQQSEALRLDSICGKVPVQFDASVHGYHRWCYNNFTNVSKFSGKGIQDTTTEAVSSSTLARRSGRGVNAGCEGNDVLFPRDQCIFCDKGHKKVKGSFKGLVTCLTEQAETNIKQMAEQKKDFTLLGKIAGVDLRAREARYHESCRRAYVRYDQRVHHSCTEEDKIASMEQKEASRNAFQYIYKHVESSIVEGGDVKWMTMLRGKYVDFMIQHYPQHYNAHYKTDRLKERLVNHFGNRIAFWLPTEKHTSELVYAADLDTGEAVQAAFEASTSEAQILSKSSRYN